MLENFGIDYEKVLEKLSEDKDIKPVKGNEDKMMRVAFDFFRLKDANPETLWQVQKADDGQEYLMRTFSDGEEEGLKAESDWDVQLNKEGTDLTIYKSDVPVHRMDLNNMKIGRDESEGFRAFVYGKLQKNDTDFLQKLAMEMPLTKISALKESGIVDLDEARTKAEWAVLDKIRKSARKLTKDIKMTILITTKDLDIRDRLTLNDVDAVIVKVGPTSTDVDPNRLVTPKNYYSFFKKRINRPLGKGSWLYKDSFGMKDESGKEEEINLSPFGKEESGNITYHFLDKTSIAQLNNAFGRMNQYYKFDWPQRKPYMKTVGNVHSLIDYFLANKRERKSVARIPDYRKSALYAALKEAKKKSKPTDMAPFLLQVVSQTLTNLRGKNQGYWVKNQYVGEVQKILKRERLYRGIVDSMWGPMTRNAWNGFIKKYPSAAKWGMKSYSGKQKPEHRVLIWFTDNHERLSGKQQQQISPEQVQQMKKEIGQGVGKATDWISKQFGGKKPAVAPTAVTKVPGAASNVPGGRAPAAADDQWSLAFQNLEMKKSARKPGETMPMPKKKDETDEEHKKREDKETEKQKKKNKEVQKRKPGQTRRIKFKNSEAQWELAFSSLKKK